MKIQRAQFNAYLYSWLWKLFKRRPDIFNAFIELEMNLQCLTFFVDFRRHVGSSFCFDFLVFITNIVLMMDRVGLAFGQCARFFLFSVHKIKAFSKVRLFLTFDNQSQVLIEFSFINAYKNKNCCQMGLFSKLNAIYYATSPKSAIDLKLTGKLQKGRKNAEKHYTFWEYFSLEISTRLSSFHKLRCVRVRWACQS